MHKRFLVRILASAAVVSGFAVASACAANAGSDSRAVPELTRRVDEAIGSRLQAEKVRPAPRADDAEFIRRVYLDLTGNIPPAAKVVAFLDDRRPDKRARLVDELLDSPAYGRHMSDVWVSLLVTHTSDNRFLDFEPLRAWLEAAFNANKPWDALVRELMTASGSPEENGAVVYFLANTPVDKVTDNCTKVFLGVQLQCAQCHNHPFTKWKQDEYWGMAAFFLKVQARLPRPVMAAKGMDAGVEEVAMVRRGKRGLPDSAKIVPAKFLGGDEPKVEKSEPLRPTLAAWMTSVDNRYFSRAMVNRTWAHLFGRGFVNPVDDMHDGNPPSHPELLADLAGQFAAGGFDVKNLYRALCNSEAYQRTSKLAGTKADVPPELFARMAIKMLTPEQMFDSLTLVLGNPDGPRPGRPGKGGKGQPAVGKGVFGAKPEEAKKDDAKKADAKPDLVMALRQRLLSPRNLFVTFFKVEDADPTEYQAGIPQALRLMNAPPLNNAMAASPLVRSGKPVPRAVQDLYLATVSRRPSQHEVERAVTYVSRQKDTRQGLSDVLWALLNSSEFSMNH